MTTTITPTANPNLTDAECDALLRGTHAVVRLQITNMRYSGIIMYRRSQYDTLARAKSVDHARGIAVLTGYISLCDALETAKQTAELLDHNAASEDVRVVVKIDADKLPECWLADAHHEVNRYLVRKGWYTVIA